MLKIAVYTIALNEEKFVERWYESAKAADLLLIADTGSTDRTVTKARKLGVRVEEIKVEPWRFDIARNINLDMVPEDFDICIQLDMDEILPQGWRPKVEEAFLAGNVWPYYRHVTRRRADGSAHTFQMYFKIHPRHGLRWKYPIHEILVPVGNQRFNRLPIDLEVDHKQDLTKPRSTYCSLLEAAVEEEPSDWRMNHYLQREYRYANRWSDVIKQGSKALKIEGGWNVERAATCMWNAESAFELGFTDWAIEWNERSIREAPLFFEPKGLRAHFAYRASDWRICYKFAIQLLHHTRQSHHLVRPHYWEWYMFDLIAMSAFHLKNPSEAVHFGKLAIEGNPDDIRLRKNLKFYEKGL
jgi:glycosyltransferase involved in cell wall biosynthesis